MCRQVSVRDQRRAGAVLHTSEERARGPGDVPPVRGPPGGPRAPGPHRVRRGREARARVRDGPGAAFARRHMGYGHLPRAVAQRRPRRGCLRCRRRRLRVRAAVQASKFRLCVLLALFSWLSQSVIKFFSTLTLFSLRVPVPDAFIARGRQTN